MLLRSRARSSVVEQLAFNQLVVGSIPTGLTKRLSVVSCPLSARGSVSAQNGVTSGREERSGCEEDDTRPTRRTNWYVEEAERARQSRRAVMRAREHVPIV